MILLSVNAVTKHFGPDPVLAGVSFEVRPGDRIGLVGPNGTGKTTLLNILAGEEESDSGTHVLHPSARWGYLQQQAAFAPGRTVMDEARAALSNVLDLAQQAVRVAQAMSESADEEERRRLGQRFDHLQHELDRQGAYTLDHKIERVLAGLGFAPNTYEQPIEQLSGGQQNRLLLARLLLAEPDLMLLDEPSNHLDIEATQWLENYLAETRQALIVVSHDRYFLDKVTTRTLELFRGTVESYPGNFSAYWRQKAERLEVERRTYERQQTEIAKMEDFIRRNHYGQKSAQAEDRRKKLERMERVALPREIAAPVMGFAPATRTGDIALRVEHLSKGFPSRPLFRDLSFDILRGQRWGVLGPNGSGKTTLLRVILDLLPADEGRAIFGAGVSTGYFDQLLSGLDPHAQVLDAVRPPHKEFVEQQRRDLLARFGIIGAMVFQRVDSLSGGERNRTALARLAALDANFLVLDEPTNHLDLWARASLEKSIKEFQGTVLMVSHDRYFLNQVADHLLVVEPDRYRVVEGNYDMYLHLVRSGLAGGSQSAEPSGETSKNGSADSGGEKRGGKPSRALRPKRRFPYRKVTDLEAEIFQRESRIEELHQLLGSPEVLRDGQKVKACKSELEEQQAALATLYEHWEEASELN